MVNIGMDHHPIHMHGHTFAVTGTEGGRQKESAWITGNTVLVGVAQARDVELTADNPGDWMVHCHLPHHMMNSMMDLLSDRPISTSPLSQKQSDEQMQRMKDGHAMTMNPPGARQQISSDASAVPGFPQDGLMEMPDDEVTGRAAEFMDLPANWSAGMQGMMTLLRVMPPEQYNRYLNAKRDDKLSTLSSAQDGNEIGDAR
jgi:hypothetical protein